MSQGVFPFLRRAERRERAFKRAILATTALVVLALVAGTRTGRHAVASAGYRARWWTIRQLGLEPPRDEVEADRARSRLLGVDRTRGLFRRTVAESDPGLGRFLEAARMGPDTALIRWGNFDQALVLSSDVFEPDDAGRSYKLRPNTRSIWYIGLSLNRVSSQFEVPDTPEVRRAAEGVWARIVPDSAQSTNSWGCRGPEPDPAAPLRGIVLGDSVMQGLLVGDDDTPPAHLARELGRRRGTRASILNTGVLGYSLEQYYYTLMAFADRMRPHFLIISICGNDFGSWDDPAHWDEGKYWLDRIGQFCRTRQLPYLVVSWPGEDSLLGLRDDSVYPGLVSRIAKSGGMRYLYPIEAFTDEDLRQRHRLKREGRPASSSPLYNRHLLGDNHMSPLGCATWARAVADRLSLVLDWEATQATPTPGPSGTASLPTRSPID